MPITPTRPAGTPAVDDVAHRIAAEVAESAVFLDPTGRRRRRLRRVVVATALVLAIVLALTLPVLLRSPSLGRPHEGPLLSKKEVGSAAPVVGEGPLTRVVRLHRAGGRTTATDAFTGAAAGTLTDRDARRAGDAEFAVQHHGYSHGATRTIALTYDDGPNEKVTPRLLDLLARNRVPATFFVVGRYAVQNEELVRRMRREGHAVGVHTISHPSIATEPDWRARVEVVGAERIVRSITGESAPFWRMPFDSPRPEDNQRTVDGLLRAQHLGYAHAGYDWDSDDWEWDARPDATARDIPLPDLTSGRNLTVLLHDGGGPNRMRTVEYTQRLVDHARAHGYTFVTMPQVVPSLAQGNRPVAAGWADRAWVLAIKAQYQWPDVVMRALFLGAVGAVLVVGVAQAVLAVWRHRRRRAVAWPAPEDMGLGVSVVVAAYDEEPVIARTLRSVLASRLPFLEILVVDDGSKDGTAREVAAVAAEDPRVVLVRQPNGGKASALNHALRVARGEVVVTLDADTIVTPDTVTNLVRHFALDDERSLGAVAGVVRVGNRRSNLLTRWQAFEYVSQIGLERAAQDCLGAISIIPGACAAWRLEAIRAAGGYSTTTLAEDCDLALTLHELGWRVSQDDEALAYTEAPETVDDLLAQRTRWAFGTLQAVAKHRRLLFSRRHGWLGWFVLPSYVTSIVVPLLFIPFVGVMALMTLQLEGPWMLLKYFLAFLAVQMVLAAIGLRLMGESVRQVAIVPLYRVVYEPLRAYLLYTSALIALKGVRLGWNKLQRTGSMDAGHSPGAGAGPGDPVAVPALPAPTALEAAR